MRVERVCCRHREGERPFGIPGNLGEGLKKNPLNFRKRRIRWLGKTAEWGEKEVQGM